MSVTVVEIREEREWRRLEPQWNELLRESAAATVFLTWQWVTAWWSAYGQSDELWILTAVDETGALRGIAPLRRHTVQRYGQSYRTIEFLGDGSNDSDYLDFIVARGFEEPVMGAFARILEEELKRGVILRLREMPSASPTYAFLARFARTHIWTEYPVPCAVVRLPDAWDGYLKMLKPRFRTKVRSVLRHFEDRSDVRFGFCESTSEAKRLLPILFDLHTRRWNHDGQPGVFGWDRKRQFYSDLSPLLLERGWLRFSWLEWKGRILATQYGFVYDHTYLHLQEGYEPAAEHWNVGVALRAWTIREFLGQGVREYDFLAGVGRHKTDWGAEVKESRQVLVATQTYRNLLFCRGPEWKAEIKRSVGKLLPEAVLSARRARLERRSLAAPPAGVARERLQRVAARCYFNLGVPAVTQRLRERYQLSLSPNGRLPGLAWTKRREPAGRIFCYHRVNDDRDPFFPSMPVDTFERQMRFVSRRYKLVSLSGLIAHLESGAPENVLAITFDDGYRDNFENAFPVLQRYGVPATIFLATGSLDSNEPLWFERLAAAVKTTGRTSLDVECDLPRRFWMRTADERLRASGDLFAWLRHLPEEERQDRLRTILDELAAPESPPGGDRMLTWDQARYMNRHGVDFGGHTVSHAYLSRLSRQAVSWEIGECKRRIESELQTPVAHFAYPNGREEDFAPWNKEVIRAAGYQAAVTTLWGLNFRTTDRMELRRSGPWEEDEAVFASKMDWYDLVNG
jgi:peptidoglycan/xylan/chitin deacetylase (PgdA/CDA1 family)/CelD/BcsL family acetyltransferase involved in cellulose biosynthesis